MTTGTVGFDPFNGTFNGVGFYRTWNGTDGKTEPYAGGVRAKWNAYSTTIAARRRDDRYKIMTPSGVVTLNAVCSFPVTTLPFTANDQQRLLTKLLAKVKSHEFNLAVDLAQLKQTTGLLASNLGHLGRAALYLKRGDFVSALREFGAEPRSKRLKGKDISARWLELSYGWLPLLGSCYEAAKAFEHLSSGPRTNLFRVSIENRRTLDGSHGLSVWSSPYQVITRRYLQYEMYEEMSFARQLGALDPLSVLWELTPWSFVVDWFIPIGSYLENLMQIPNLRGRFLTTDVSRCFGMDGFVAKSSGGYHQGYQFLGQVSSPIDVYRRTVMNRVPSSSLSVPLPSFDLSGSFSVRRLWNAIALAHQRFAA